ncbi:hypothetical protein SSSV4_ORF111 [Sulfolobus spindle-shaped virus 4]|uniref:Conserved proviral protein n=3 Tax=root TaxID=1 RepID=F0NFS6_SACI5|nr:hypothetical protein [Sulfolobus islandicus]YP_001552212.1 hypothetical protein SSSV4_ORF111 [Sulfolobus spindle-shaped virus 4]YP_002221499.1 hypothetical protein SSSV5_gp34 [Sulfolobus spindle-shaped virus 5]AQQ16883.1 ORF33 [Sulfolobus spindle-shaped virus 3]ABV26221.1 hypothetical protein [Sulfolobus spindle-shaped virus 4]ABV26255.1 hypothetical protein [Sulfolobus spindle-shaped virus 5]ADX86462.1 conserved proviral protein [Sulfolobus islandicus REY15A]
MEFSSLLIFVSGIIVSLLTLYFSPDFGRVKPNKRNLSVVFLSIVLVGIGLWFYTIDHPTFIVLPYKEPPGGFYLGPPPTKCIPPPWYANLWPFIITIGLSILIIPLIRPKK